jgi:probable rRNA maturation factor
MPAKFHEQEVKSGLKEKRRLSAFLDTVVAKYRPEVAKARLTYILCNDEYLLQMNQQFLNHDTLTDIITFDLSEDNDAIEGEIYISTERVAENATKFKVSMADELHRVIFHGALHLCGFKDKKMADKKIMRQKEDECLAAYNN